MPAAAPVIRVLAVALIASITQIALTVAFTSLTFRDGLSAELGLGLGAMFLGMTITAIAVGVGSGLPGHLVSPQDGGLVVLSVIAPTVLSTTDAPGETLVALMGLSSIAVGGLMIVLGRSGLGRLIRFLPYPVLAGFLAGTGFVIAIAAYGLAAGGISGDATGGADRASRLAVVIVIAGLLTMVSRTSLPTERYVPLIVIGSIGSYHAVAAVADLTRSAAAERGWLLPILPDGGLLSRRSFRVFLDADWVVLAEHIPSMLPLLLLVPLTVLLYLGALETVLDVDIDTNREFQVTGGAGVVAGVLGSAPAYTQFANTLLVRQMAGPNRIVPVVVGLSAVAVLMAGDPLIALIPQPVVAGLLGFIAITFILDWTWDLRHRVNPIELTMALLIATSIVVFGFLVGVAVGLLLAAGWFVVQYSQISGVRRVRDARHVRSNVFRSPSEDAALRDAGGRTLIVELEGFLFFGTGDAVHRAVSSHPDLSAVQWLIVDFTRVSGADSSAVASFVQLMRWARAEGLAIRWVSLKPEVSRPLAPLLRIEGVAELDVDLDRALASIEDTLLAAEGAATSDTVGSALDLAVVAAAEVSDVPAGGTILTAGEPVDALMVIERGRVSVLGVESDARLRQLGPGSVLGELSLYGDGVATATVVADEVTTIRRVGLAAITELEASNPAAAAELHRHLAEIVAERLRTASAALDAFGYGGSAQHPAVKARADSLPTDRRA